MDWSCDVETYEAEPRPVTVDVIVVLRKVVDVRPAKFGEETKPAV